MIKEYLKKTFVNTLYIQYKHIRFRKKWLRQNKHNGTTANNIFDPQFVNVGKATYGELNVIQFSSNHVLHIGNYVSIAQEVTFILDSEHYTDHISTFPFKVKLLKTEKSESFGKGDIIVEDDVWIGYRSTIMSGVHIGQGAVIAAGAVVTKDVPPYAVVGGVPAHIVKYRFNEDICHALKKMDYSILDEQSVLVNLQNLYEPIRTVEDARRIMSIIDSTG